LISQFIELLSLKKFNSLYKLINSMIKIIESFQCFFNGVFNMGGFIPQPENITVLTVSFLALSVKDKEQSKRNVKGISCNARFVCSLKT